MRVIVVDDERIAVDAVLLALKGMDFVSESVGFTSPQKALEDFREHGAQVALLDIQMGRTSGLSLAKSMKDIDPRVRIIFVTGYAEYAVDAFAVNASGYVMKPIKPAKLAAEFDKLLNPPPPVARPDAKRLRVQCFGHFEAFADGQPLAFPRQKSKELLAFLVDRCGARVTMPEIASALWEDGMYDTSRNNQIHSFLSDLIKALDAVGAGDVLLRQRNGLAVIPEKLSCDYYDCIGGDPAAINAYNGEYMSQYSWAEFTTGELTMKYR